jgi:SAM-dependent methyltransferase
MWASDLAELQSRYRDRYAKFGYDRRTLGWDKDCQQVRFQAALEGLRDEDYTSVLDVGCGFGDLLAYLRNADWRGRYTGIDLVPELLSEARSRHAGDANATFEDVDASAGAYERQSSLAVALGVFNHRLHQDNREFIAATLDAMWRSSTRVVVCDFLSDSAEQDKRRDDLYYANPSEILALARRYSRRVALHHAYMPFEFHVKIWHDDGYATAQPVFEPYRR